MSSKDEKLITQLGLRCVELANKLKRIKLITDRFLNGVSHSENLVREVNEACDALNDIKDVLEE